ncbi:hypothetical protein ASE75_14835 [Sphingomonas sp. Leaf17]|uniref:helix-turn-helix domain-containing protein n=1 Tax=Sphingomonas sp. Leaf17 TaxID=1735683 RepID=UPI0006F48D0A|nr:helix-turn-helix domain-containing protein [Sphingomonas sp. Leaf17]KQM62011.1 hypothetical protein ASE75_14835 [Sphingomonas sp. Leaf17]
MTAFTLGEAAGRALARMTVTGGATPTRLPRTRHCTGAPVRRGSIEAGSFEHHFFVTPVRGECDRLLRMARAALDAGRRLKRAVRAEGRVLSPAEAAMAALTAGAVRVYEEICTLARLNAGRVFPSYDRLVEATALGRATVARALVTLEQAGFLVRQRRFKRIEGDGPGPRYAQTSNVYRPTLPARLMAHLPRWLHPAPAPADVEQLAQARIDELTAMRATLSCRDVARATVGGALGRMLAELGAALDNRIDSQQHESQNQAQSLNDLYIQGSGNDALVKA